jgi:DNA-binding FadR family transcriptional regulator
MRLVVEVGAMDLAVKRITDPEITVLTDLANAMSDDRYNEDPHQSNAVNIGFHEALAGASHNVRLLKSVAQLLQELERFFYLEAQASAVYPDSYASHRDIVAAIRERDTKLARTVITDHIEGTRSVLLSSIMDGQSRGQVLLS